MDIVVYDFDKTIYAGDSMVDFYLFCLRRQPITIIFLPLQLFHIAAYLFGAEDKTKMKSGFLSFLKITKDIDQTVSLFWERYKRKIKPWYHQRQHKTIAVISASPDFLLAPIAKDIHADLLIATHVDKRSGRIVGENCYGAVKVERLLDAVPKAHITEAYTDSLSDMPILELAQQPYIVRHNKVVTLESYVSMGWLRQFLLR